MQEAHVKTWLPEPHVPAELLDSVRDLNRRFLDLVARRPGGWTGGSGEPLAPLSAQIAPLSAAQRAAAAECPYALFDLRFADAGHWRNRFSHAACGGVADAAAVAADTLEFVALALFFAWHVASTTKLAARLVLGMHETTCSAFRGATVDCLPALAAAEAGHLTARWNHCAPYWLALTGAAAAPDRANLRRVQLHGLQLAAAAQLA